ncbi:MAG: HlyD family secretion protein, partial [Bosea sp. (in: a-proteobacteria)]
VAFFLALQFVGPLIFLDADGLASKERLIVAPDYSARIDKMHVRPGDMVQAGQAIATLNSTEVIDRLAELSTRRTTLAAREIQIESRIVSLTTLKPLAIERAKRARASVNQLNDLLKRQLTTSSRLAEAIREFYEAEREEAQAIAESRTLADELKQVAASKHELEKIIVALKNSYNEGKLISEVEGRVGSRVPSRGMVTKRGDAIVDVFHGETHVIAYVPNSRLYGIDAGDKVVVTDGINRRIGHVQRMESVTDALPAEFQSNFRSQERQQVMRVAFDGEAPFPILAKVKVMSRFSPYALGSMLRTAITVADTPAEAAKLVVSELGGKDQWPMLDMSAVGSLKSFGKVEPKSPVKIVDEAEDQPFPDAQTPIDGRGITLPSPAQPDMLRRVRASQVRHQVKGPVLAGAKPPRPAARFNGWY